MNALLLAAVLAVPPGTLLLEVAGPAAPRAVFSAAADEGTESFDRHWYGWQTLIPDLAALGLFSVAAKLNTSAFNSNPIAVAGVALYLGGGPTVHFAHGDIGRGFISLALRAGLPVGALLAGALLTPCNSTSSDVCGVGSGLAIFGFFLGGISAVALDASVLSIVRVPAAPSDAPRVMPSVTFMKGRDGQQHLAAALIASF
jgi:hypothetical protein